MSSKILRKSILCRIVSGVRYMERKKGSRKVVQCTWIRKGGFVGIINNLKKGEEKRPGEPTHKKIIDKKRGHL